MAGVLNPLHELYSKEELETAMDVLSDLEFDTGESYIEIIEKIQEMADKKNN